MSTRDRRRHPEDETTLSGTSDGDDGAGEGLNEQRREIADLLRAGDEIIDRVIAGDADGYLFAGRQQGGQ